MKLSHLKNIAIYQVSFATTGLVSLFLIPIITRILTPEEYGVVAIVVALPALIASFLSGGVTFAIPRYYFEYREDRSKLSELFFSNWLFLWGGFLIAFPFIFFFKEDLAAMAMGAKNYSLAFVLAFVHAFIYGLVTLYLNLYQSMEKAWRYGCFSILYSLLSNGLGLVLIWVFNLSFMGIIYSQLFAATILFLIITIDFFRNYEIKFNFYRVIETLKYGLPILPKNISGLITRYFDKYLIMGMLALSYVGVYNIGQLVASKLFFMMGAIYYAFNPMFMKEIFSRGEAGAVFIGRNFTYFVYLSLGPILLVILFSKEIFYLLLPPTYWSALNVFIIISFGVSVQAFGKFVSVPLGYKKKAYFAFPITLAGLAVNILLNIILIPRYEILGAAISYTGTVITINIIQVLISQHFYKVKYEWYYLSLFYFNLLIAILLIFSFQWVRCSLIPQFSIKILLLLSFLLLGLHAKILTKERILTIWQAIQSKFNSKKEISS